MSFRRILLIALFLIVALPIAFATWLTRTEPGARFAWTQLEAALGGALSADAVGGTLLGGLTLEGLGYDDETVAIEVDTIVLAADLGLVPLTVDIVGAEIRGVRVELREGREPEPAGSSLSDVLEGLVLPLRVRVGGLVATDIAIRGEQGAARVIDRVALDGSMSDTIQAELLLEAPEGKIELDGALGLLAPHAVDLEMRLSLTDEVAASADIEAAGTVEAVDVAAAAEAVLEGYGRVAVEVTGRATPSDARIDTLTLASDDVELAATGAVRWAGGLTASGEVDVSRALPARFVEAWPAAHPLAARFGFAVEPGRIRIENGTVGVRGTDMQVRVNTAIDLDAETVDGRLDWRQLQWPVGVDRPQVSSPGGDVELSGSLDDWTVAGELAIEADGVDPGRFEIGAEGDRGAAKVTVAGAGVLGGIVSGTSTVSWTGAREWSAALSARNVRIDALAPSLPGRVSGRVEASGSAEPLAFVAFLDEVNGELAGRPLAARGQIALEDGVLSASDLFVRHGANEVTLNGSPQSVTGLVFSGYVDDLGDYVPAAEGRLRAAGRAGLEDGLPWLSLTAAADRLVLGDVEVTAFRVDDLAPGVRTRSRLNVTAGAVAASGHEILSPSIEFNVTPETQSLKVDVGYEGLRFAAFVEGALDSWGEPREWVGELAELEFAFEGHPPVELANRADLRFARDAVSIERLCVREPGGAALCSAFSWRAGGRLDLSANLNTMPAQMVNALVETGFNFDQLVSGELEWHRAADTPPTGRARLVASPGSITNVGRPEVSFETAESTLEFEVVGGQLLAGNLSLPMPGTGEIAGYFNVLDLSNPLASDVEGAATIALENIGALAAFTPFVDEAAGSLSGRVEVGGRANAVSLTGDLNLTDGMVVYDPIGLELTDIDLTARLRGDRAIEIEGEFQSGDGRARVTSRGANGNGNGINIAIVGSNLRLVDVEDLTAFADLDLGLTWLDDTLTIDGRVAIPRARVTPATLPETPDTESPDVVIVNGELPGKDDEDDAAELRILGSLDVTLGSAVRVDLGVADATVTGTTNFSWSGEPIPVANGRFDIAGEIQAFGQLLTVTDGRVSFPNVSADNPTLRLRAEREIFGNSQVKTAGVLVAGSLARPTIEAYTIPRTTEERALTLLVTGSDFDLEQGIGAVDFGTYIAPRLYLSYGVGIFERDNVISARYDLTSGWGVRATSGQRESGVDVIYRLER